MFKRSEVQAHCVSKPGAAADFPFGPEAEVFKVMGKMFALLSTDEPSRISLKGDPGWNEAIRQTYEAVTAGYHLNKRHWNTIELGGDVPDEELREMIDRSYELVVSKLTKAQRAELESME